MALKNKDHICFENVGLRKNEAEDDTKQAYTNVALQQYPETLNYSEVESNGVSEEVENQLKENLQRKLQEAERLQRIEANERLKNKRQQRKNLKEKKKQIRLEAEKILQEKKFSKPPPEREKSELEKHEEKLNDLFGEKEVNNDMVQNTAKITTDSETKSLLLGKHFSETDRISANSDKQQCKTMEITNLISTYKSTTVPNQREITTVIKQREATAVIKQRETTTVIKRREITAEQKESLTSRSAPSSQQRSQIDKGTETKPTDGEVKSSLLQRHLQEYSDLMKVQPKRHTEQQIRVERIRQREEQQTLHQQELESLRSKQTQEFVPVPSGPSDPAHSLTGEDECVQEEFERMRKEHLRKQQELERKRNEEEAQELKTYRNKKQKWKELKMDDVPQKWFEKEETVTKDPPPKVKEPPPPSVNIWQQRHLRQQQLSSLAPRTTQEEEEILNQVLLLSQKTAAQEEEQRKYREIMSAKNFAPEKIKKEGEPMAMFNRPVDTAQQKNTTKTVTAPQSTKKTPQELLQTKQETRPATTQHKFPAPQSSKKTTTEQVENIWEILPDRAKKKTFPSTNWVSSSKEKETAPRPILTTNYANMIPSPRIHIEQQPVKEESWDNDGEFLYVSKKLPTTARECLRWQNNAKIVMSASGDSQTDINNSAHKSSRLQESKPSVDKTCSTADENHNDITTSSTKLRNSKSRDSKLVSGSIKAKQSETRDSGENISEVVKTRRYLSDNSEVKRSDSSENQSEAVELRGCPPIKEEDPNHRNPWTDVVIEHQVVDPRPNAETVWLDNKQETERSLHSAQIPMSTCTSINNPSTCKIPAGRNLEKSKTSPTDSYSMSTFKSGNNNSHSDGTRNQMSANKREVEVQNTWSQSTGGGIPQPFNQNNSHDFWNISVENSANTTQDGKTQNSSMNNLHVCDESEEKAKRLIANLQKKTYQASSEGSRVSQDYWDLNDDLLSKAKNENPPEIFILPENVKAADMETASEASTVTSQTPVLSLAQNYDEQVTTVPENFLKVDISKEERSSATGILPTGLSESVHSNTSLVTTQKGSVPQTVPQKKVSNMLNKLAKLGLNPNPIKKEKTGENPSLSKPSTPAHQKSQRPGYKQRPMKTVAKSPTNTTGSLPAENWETVAQERNDGIPSSENWESLLNQDQPIPSGMNSIFSSSSNEKSETSEGHWKKSKPPVISSDFVSQRNQNSSVSARNIVDQTRQSMVEDWESELVTLPPDSNTLPAPTCPSTTEAKNFFKEIMKSVKKDAVKPRLPVLKHLTAQEESPLDSASKTDQSSNMIAQTSPSSNEWIGRDELVGDSYIAQKITTETNSKPVFQGHKHSMDHLTNLGQPQTTCHPSASVKPSFNMSPRAINEDTAPPQVTSDSAHSALVDQMQDFSAANSTDTRVPKHVHAPPPPNLPHPAQSPPVYSQVPGVGSGFVAGNPGGPSNFGLPMALPPHLVQAYLQYLATTRNALGTGLLPGLSLLPGITPIVPLGLPNPLLPNPLLSYNLMGLPSQPFADPSTFGTQLPVNTSSNPPHFDVSPSQPDVSPSHPEVNPPQHYTSPSQPDVNLRQPYTCPSQPDVSLPQPDVSLLQPHAHPLSQSQPQCGMHINSSHHQVPDIRVDYQSDQQAFDPSSHPGTSYPPQNNAPPPQKINAKENPQHLNLMPTENTSVPPSKFDSKGRKDGPLRNVFEISRSSDKEVLEAKLPKTLQKRKEQTRTVQALIQHVLKENQERDTVDLIPDMNRI